MFKALGPQNSCPQTVPGTLVSSSLEPEPPSDYTKLPVIGNIPLQLFAGFLSDFWHWGSFHHLISGSFPSTENPTS